MQNSLSILLKIFTETNNRDNRVALTNFNPEVRSDFYAGFVSNLQAIDYTQDRISSEVSLILSMKMLWGLVPAKLFSSINPNYERYAGEALKKQFSIPVADFDHVEQLALIFKRLRSSVTVGRPRTSLDLDRPSHMEILEQQCGRCALCLYRFPSLDPIEMYETDEYYIERYQPLENECVLDKYFRRPVLDHIIPYYLGGDGQENWQILCQTCNSGKGEATGWFARKGWMPPSRPSDISLLTPALRYSCLADYNAQINRDEGSLPFHGTLRVFKKDAERIVVFENLKVFYC